MYVHTLFHQEKLNVEPLNAISEITTLALELPGGGNIAKETFGQRGIEVGKCARADNDLFHGDSLVALLFQVV